MRTQLVGCRCRRVFATLVANGVLFVAGLVVGVGIAAVASVAGRPLMMQLVVVAMVKARPAHRY